MLSLSVISTCFYGCCLKFFPDPFSSFITNHPPPLRLQSVVQNARDSSLGRLSGLWSSASRACAARPVREAKDDAEPTTVEMPGFFDSILAM